MHDTLLRPQPREGVAIAILAESPETVLMPRGAKGQGYGALVSIGLVLIAIVITILFYLRRQRRDGNRPPIVDLEREDRGEPQDDELK